MSIKKVGQQPITQQAALPELETSQVSTSQVNTSQSISTSQEGLADSFLVESLAAQVVTPFQSGESGVPGQTESVLSILLGGNDLPEIAINPFPTSGGLVFPDLDDIPDGATVNPFPMAPPTQTEEPTTTQVSTRPPEVAINPFPSTTGELVFPDLNDIPDGATVNPFPMAPPEPEVETNVPEIAINPFPMF